MTDNTNETANLLRIIHMALPMSSSNEDVILQAIEELEMNQAVIKILEEKIEVLEEEAYMNESSEEELINKTKTLTEALSEVHYAAKYRAESEIDMDEILEKISNVSKKAGVR